jgi:hypothetical protein
MIEFHLLASALAKDAYDRLTPAAPEPMQQEQKVPAQDICDAIAELLEHLKG